ANCPSCKFEEFFLTSWAVGDPAMVVDRQGFNCTASGACLNGNSCNPDLGDQCLLNTCNKTTKLCPDGKTSCTQDSDCRTCTATAFSCQNAPATKAFYP